MAKKLTLFVFILCVAAKSFGQYYDTSYFSVNADTYAHGMRLINSGNDKYGNIYYVIETYGCMTCHDAIIKKIGSLSSWTYHGLHTNTPADFIFNGDAAGNTYAFGSYNSYVSINGVTVNLTTDSAHLALIKLDTIGKAQWAINTRGNKWAVNDSGYCFILSSDSVTMYNPSGVLIWSRAGGGIQIEAENSNNYYIRSGNGLVKYDSNGNVLWHVPSNSIFKKSFNDRCFLYDLSQIREVSSVDGSLISTSQNFSDSLLFFDKDGCYYEKYDSILIKYNATGKIWNTRLTGTRFAYVGIDQRNNIYFSNIYGAPRNGNSGNSSSAKFFVPPALYYDPPGLSPPQRGFGAIYSGRINQQDNFTPQLETDSLKALCKKSENDISFSFNKYLVSYTNGIRAELSDSSGSFSNPVTIGKGIRSPIIGKIPFFNLEGTHYRIRVVADDANIVGKPSGFISQLVDPTKLSIVYSNLYLPSVTSCDPLILSVQPGDNLICKWTEKKYDALGYQDIHQYNDSLNVLDGVGESYIVVATDTLTGCPVTLTARDVYAGSGGLHVYFYLPDTVCLNAEPVDMVSHYQGGYYSGDFVHNNLFYPDSAGVGTHPVHLRIEGASSCFHNIDSVKNIYVKNKLKEIKTTNIYPRKEAYCADDSIYVNFFYDPSLFNPGNKFIVELGGYYPEYSNSFGVTAKLDSGVTSPIACKLPPVYNGENYRIRVRSTDPPYIGTLNNDGFLKIGKPIEYASHLFVDGTDANCGAVNSILTLSPIYYYYDFKFQWHVNNEVYTDSLNSNYGSSFFAKQKGNYSIELIDEFTCKAYSDTVHIGLPSANITTNDPVVFCTGDSVVLSVPAQPNCNYQWKKGGADIPSAIASSYTALVGGSYKVKVENRLTGCVKISPSSVLLSRNSSPSATITPQGPTTFCNGDHVLLKANAGNSLIYKWKKDGLFIPGAIAKNYTAFAGGTYKVQVTDVNGCKKVSAGITVNVPCREAGESNTQTETTTLQIFPNPSGGTFQVQSVEKINQLIITNLSGQVILQHTNPDIADAALEIDISNQSKGIYLLLLTTDREVYNRKLVLE